MKTTRLRWLWGLLMAAGFMGKAIPSFADMPCGLKDYPLKSDVAWKAPLDIPTPSGWALSWPEAVVGASKFWFDHDQHENGYVDGTRSLDGTRFDLNVEVRNGSKIDGRHFAVMLELIDGQGKIVKTTNTVNPFMAGYLASGVNPAGYCRTLRKGHRCSRLHQDFTFMVELSKVNQVVSLRIVPGLFSTISDQALINEMLGAGACVAEHGLE